MPRIVPSQIVEFIEARFPRIKDGKDFSCGYHEDGVLSTLLSLTDELPVNLLPRDSSDLIRFIEACQEIRSAIALWRSGQPNALTHEFRYMRDGSGNPVTALRNALAKCPDEGIVFPEEELPFLSDQEFKDTIRQDISSANQALTNAEWKASTVLAGSVIEALLLYAIDSLKGNDNSRYCQATEKVISDIGLGKALTKKPSGNPNEWRLEQYIHMAFALNLLSETTAKECLLTKDYRNLIHHGASERKKQKCDRGTALLAVAAMEHVIKEFRDRM